MSLWLQRGRVHHQAVEEAGRQVWGLESDAESEILNRKQKAERERTWEIKKLEKATGGFHKLCEPETLGL